MARQRYEITVTFTYQNGTPGGVLHTIVNSKKAVEIQMAANKKWLAQKGHTINTITVNTK